jgi:amino acid permease
MGGNLCLASLATEFSLASVSLLINIGVNINTVFPAISIIQGIFISSVVSVLLVNIEDLKSFSYISSFGNSFILLSMAVMVISGTQFQMSEEISAHAYKYFDASGIPLSLGLIVFCYGGIGAFPKIYLSLEKREDHTNLLWLSGVIIIGVYCMVSVTGYGLFCSYTEMPITKNFGYNSHKIDLPFGVVERCLAALGIAFNMQITIPLILFTLKDLVMSISSGAAASRRSLISFLLCLGCMLAAMGLHSNFASLCSLVGSFCTSLNSVCLPVVFYHKLHKGNVSATRTAIHAMMLAFVITASALGITSSFCRIFTMTAGICSYV